MNRGLPIWVNIVRWILDTASWIAGRCHDKSMSLLDRHCRCEICKKDKRGRYRDQA
jgi:hypothetical protein